jgi:hypothetical protein
VAGVDPEERSVAEGAGEETVAKARTRVIAVAEAASALRSRIESIDSELDRLVETLRSAGARLDGELGAIERDVAALYEAAGMRSSGGPGAPETPFPQAATAGVPEARKAAEASVEEGGEQTRARSEPAGASPPPADLEGARLTALNMALNGDPREAIARCLAEHFDLSEPDRLIDEVCSAVES